MKSEHLHRPVTAKNDNYAKAERGRGSTALYRVCGHVPTRESNEALYLHSNGHSNTCLMAHNCGQNLGLIDWLAESCSVRAKIGSITDRSIQGKLRQSINLYI